MLSLYTYVYMERERERLIVAGLDLWDRVRKFNLERCWTAMINVSDELLKVEL